MPILSITIFGFFDLLIMVCQNCPIDFKLGTMIPNTVRYNVEKNSIIMTLKSIRPFKLVDFDIF